MRRAVERWLLIGALVASAGLNVLHAKSEVSESAPCAAKSTAVALPIQADRPLVDKLKLTASQKQQFAVCSPDFMKERVQLHGLIDDLIVKLEQELQADRPDTERLHELADEIGKARADQLKTQMGCILLVRETLTPDQLKKLSRCCGQEQ